MLGRDLQDEVGARSQGSPGPVPATTGAAATSSAESRQNVVEREHRRRERLEQAAHDLQVMRSVDGDPYVAERAPELDDVHVESAVVGDSASRARDRASIASRSARSSAARVSASTSIPTGYVRPTGGAFVARSWPSSSPMTRSITTGSRSGQSEVSRTTTSARAAARAGIAGEHVMLAAAEDAGAGGGRDVGDRTVATPSVVATDSVERGRLLDAVEHRREQRPAGDDGERLARQAGRAHAGLDDRDDTRHSAGEASGRRYSQAWPPGASRSAATAARRLAQATSRASSPARHGLRGGGARSTFIGKLDGLAAGWRGTRRAAAFEAPADGPLGVDPARFDAAVVDLYDTDVCPLARALPVATPAEAS